MAEAKKEATVSKKNRTVALLLVVMLGWMGGHRFYVNKVGTGFLMMFTMGGFGLWYFIDMVMVALGAFQDKDDLPIKKWA